MISSIMLMSRVEKRRNLRRVHEEIMLFKVGRRSDCAQEEKPPSMRYHGTLMEATLQELCMNINVRITC